MRRLRLQGQNERLLREAVRGMLNEGIADASPEESRRWSEDVRANLPQQDTTDDVISGLGIASDSIGLALNYVRTWWAKPVNLLFDHTSVLASVVQYSRAASRYEEFVFTKNLDTLDPDELEDLRFIYEADYYIAATFAVISVAAAAASVAEIVGWQPGSAVEAGLKGLKIIGSITYGLSISEVAGLSPADIAQRVKKIRDFINGPDFAALKASFDKLSPLLEGKEVQGSIAGYATWLVTGGAGGGKHDVSLFRALLDKGFSSSQRAMIQTWLANARSQANAR